VNNCIKKGDLITVLKKVTHRKIHVALYYIDMCLEIWVKTSVFRSNPNRRANYHTTWTIIYWL